jgi:hypothetical protein
MSVVSPPSSNGWTIPLSSQKYGFGIRNPRSGNHLFWIQGSKWHRNLDPGSGRNTENYPVIILRKVNLTIRFIKGLNSRSEAVPSMRAVITNGIPDLAFHRCKQGLCIKFFLQHATKEFVNPRRKYSEKTLTFLDLIREENIHLMIPVIKTGRSP